MNVKYKINLIYATSLISSLWLIVALWNSILQSSESWNAQIFREEGLQQGIELSEAKSELFFDKVNHYLENAQVSIGSSQAAQDLQNMPNWFLLNYQGQLIFNNSTPEETIALVSPDVIMLATDRMEIENTENSVVDNYDLFLKSPRENILPTRVYLRVYEDDQIVLAYGHGLYSVMARIKAHQLNTAESARRFLLIGGSISTLMTLLFLLAGLYISNRIISLPILRIINGIRSQADNSPSGIVESGTNDEFHEISTTINELMAQTSKLLQDTALSEQRFRSLFEDSEISIWNEDFSEILSTMTLLRKDGVEDLRAYLNTNEEVVLDLAKKVKVTQVNQATLTLFGAENEVNFIDQIDKSFGPKAQEVFKNQLCAIWSEEPDFRSQANMRTFDGKPIRVILSYQIPKSKEGFKSIPVSIIDITEQKSLEEQLRQSQKMEAVGQLTGGVAHDFNNLLAVMLGNAELLEDEAGEDKEAMKNIEAIKAAVVRASSLTSRLLAFSRQSALTPVAADVCELIGGLNDMLQRALGETVELRVEETEDLWPAMIDTHQFENALVNLALNARDSMLQGGILTIETANVTLDDTYAEQYEEVTPGDYVKVAVSDTGTGIRPDVLEKVFEPFFTTKEVGKGSGLGLSMVFGFAKQSNGHVTIYSEVGHGTSVKLYMPRSQDRAVETNVKDNVLEHVQGSERILVVEDEADVRKISVAILGGHGYEVVEAGNGEEAIGHLKAGKPFSLLFTDVVLPNGMNGAEIAEEAKRIQPDIKVLYTTGYAENAVIHQGKLDRGMNLVNKPYRRTELLEKVRKVIDEKSL